MIHSILTTHRNRNWHLALCIRSITRSADLCGGGGGYEIVVVENGSDIVPSFPNHPEVRVVIDDRPMEVFNKPKLLNRAIAEAQGDVLTFLDADAIVGTHWIEGVGVLEDPAIIRLCYRVRMLPASMGPQIAASLHPDMFLAGLFRVYNGKAKGAAGLERFLLAWEAYRDPGFNRPEPGYEHKVFGNSQFSVTRENLGALRPNEVYEGKGFEDLEFNRQFHRHYGDRYRGFMSRVPERNMFHLAHEYDVEHWSDPALNQVNRDRYMET